MATIYTYQYRPLASVQKLLFLETTEVVELGEDAVHIPKYGFQFVDLSVLRSRADDVTTLSDIVGCFCGFGEVEVVGAGYKKRDIKIFTDYSITSTFTLWGKLGEMFEPSLYTGDGAPFVFVMSGEDVSRLLLIRWSLQVLPIMFREVPMSGRESYPLLLKLSLEVVVASLSTNPAVLAASY